MLPVPWMPPVDLSAAEARIVGRVRRAKLFVFLRQIRHHLFDVAFQAELATLYRDGPAGSVPVPPAQLALATLLQAYTGVSDDEVIEALVMDRRWQLVLDCLDADRPPFSKATLVRFRAALIAADLDRRLLERTVELAHQTGGFSPRALRAALDSSPLWGAGRVEDTLNLMGHALRRVLGVVADQQGRGLADLAAAAGAPLVAGTSLKAALDLDWTDPSARATALALVVAAVDRVTAWVGGEPAATHPAVQDGLATVVQVRAQDVVEEPDQPAMLRQGVAVDRRISISDPQMRHGRKSRAVRVDGYKRHLVRDLDSAGLIVAVGLTAANAPEASVTPDLEVDLVRQGRVLSELHIDRAYLSSHWVREREPEVAVRAKAWPATNRGRYPKTAFRWEWTEQTVTCPAGAVAAFTPGQVTRFGAVRCGPCAQRAQCTTSRAGRSISVHPDERLLSELRSAQQTPAGRAVLRERVAVEHSLAHIGQWQGDRARYRGIRKNLFDLRRVAAVNNLHVLARHPQRSIAA